MSSSFDWDANTPSQEEQPINIDLMQMKRANKAALDHLGQKWSPSHDRFAIRWLFKRGVISDFEKEILLEKVANKVHRIKKLKPDFGRFQCGECYKEIQLVS